MFIKTLNKPTPLLEINYVSLFLITFVFLFIPSLALAHGGEDHDDIEDTIPIAQGGKLNSKLAKTSHVEVLVKYPTPNPNLPTQIRAFITDINTNAPIENAKLSLVFSLINETSEQIDSKNLGVVYAGANSNEIQVDAEPNSNVLGLYQVPVTFPKAGSYQLKLKIAGSNLDASLAVSGIIVSDLVNTPIENTKINYWIFLAVATLFVIVAISGLVYHRWGRNI